ncbi:hypothetical protein I4U23_010148 [Adineta vaga]|nr:hypothetical protein I4U23_010148 [Adineta vaga]
MAEAFTMTVPCEHCESQISLENYVAHTKKCTGNIKSQIRSKQGKIENNNSDTDQIPCEYCDTQVNMKDLEIHTKQCAIEYQRIMEETRKFEKNETVLIPCEYCDSPVKAENWEWHSKKCAEAEKRRAEEVSQKIAVRLSNDRIPCKYCGNHFRLQAFEEHQKKCRRGQLRIVSRPVDSNITVPEQWDQSSTSNLARYTLDPESEEYKSIADNFHKTLPTCKINQIERIQNRRWFRQYEAHKDYFIERYSKSTEQWLFHGCRRSESAEAIIQDCFNRSHAVNCAAGQGIYFAIQSYTSHRYTSPDANGLRYMFMARVLIGKTTVGSPSTRVCPPGFDTTGARGIYVTYHDAQAYGQYLITYS